MRLPNGCGRRSKAIADRYDARVKVAEVPPGPPVLSTLVAEIYGPDYDRQREIALKVRDIFEQTPGVVDVDWYMEEDQPRFDLEVDQEKAALHGISVGTDYPDPGNALERQAGGAAAPAPGKGRCCHCAARCP